MKHFTSINDVSDIKALVQKALAYKANPLLDKTLGQGKRMGLLFFNPSLRTRLSTQIACSNLGMESIVCNVGSDSWALEFEDGAVMNGTGVEHIKDAVGVLNQYFDVLGVRTFPTLKNKEDDYSEKVLKSIITHFKKPVISLESATLHPLQSLADLITIEEEIKLQSLNKKPKVVLTWAPHIKTIPQCVSNSFAQWMNAWNEYDFVITHPKGYELDEAFTQGATIEYNQDKAIADADFIYVKNWSSYQNYGEVLPVNEDWLLTEKKLANNSKAKVMHCLPVRRNVELSDDLLDIPNRNLVQQQAGNRVFSAQSVIASILNNL